MNRVYEPLLLCCGSFWYYCCPPLLSHFVRKAAFHPPKTSYHIDYSTNFWLKVSDALLMKHDYETVDVEGFYATTSRGNRIACMFIHCAAASNPPKYTVLYSHGNASDLGSVHDFLTLLCLCTECDVFAYDYSGYGLSSGKPSEKNLYADIDAAYRTLITRYGIQPENVIAFGTSLGTVPTVDLASKHPVGAVILQSPLTSALRLVFPSLIPKKTIRFFDRFVNIDKVPNIYAPVLVIHGTADDVIHIRHGFAIYERCPNTVEPLWVEGANHNDILKDRQYMLRLINFVRTDLTPGAEK